MKSKCYVYYYPKDLELFRNRSKFYGLEISDEQGNPKDVTNWLFTFTLKKNKNDDDGQAILIKDAIPSDPENGKVAFMLTKSDLDITERIYHYDISVKTNTNETFVLMYGIVEILPPVRDDL